MKKSIIALDVGGSSIKVGAVDEELCLLDEVVASYPAKSDDAAEAILQNLADIITAHWEKLAQKGYTVVGIGIGFPGPFDYQKGISYIRGLGKYEMLYGANIPAYLRGNLAMNRPELAREDFIKFENDAVTFSLGEYYKGQGAGCRRVICLTLGTGCGSTFIEDGEIVKGRDGVPLSGMIYDFPYLDSIVDDYLSIRGVLNLAKSYGFNQADLQVSDLYHQAKQGNAKARQVFEEFGAMLADVLEPLVVSFNPDGIVLGGGISQAYDIFGQKVRQRLGSSGPTIKLSTDLSKSALIGVASLFFKVSH